MIRYMPNLDSLLWSRKSMEYFNTLDELKSFIADQRTRFYSFIGMPKTYQPEQVQLIAGTGHDLITGFVNCCSVILDGHLLGFCGE